MKWIIGVVVLLIAGWLATVYLFNHTGSEKISLAVMDSSQAKQALPDSARTDSLAADTIVQNAGSLDTLQNKTVALPKGSIDTRGVSPAEVLSFAKAQIGIPYLYGSTDPTKGFDCSGFITYVFNHFNIQVPRSSVDFTNAYPEVPPANAKQGDLILFTGTDSTERTVGHMGIIVSNINDSISFIHSTSGKANGVTITPLNTYYRSRFVKIVSIFQQYDSLKAIH